MYWSNTIMRVTCVRVQRCKWQLKNCPQTWKKKGSSLLTSAKKIDRPDLFLLEKWLVRMVFVHQECHQSGANVRKMVDQLLAKKNDSQNRQMLVRVQMRTKRSRCKTTTVHLRMALIKFGMVQYLRKCMSRTAMQQWEKNLYVMDVWGKGMQTKIVITTHAV